MGLASGSRRFASRTPLDLAKEVSVTNLMHPTHQEIRADWLKNPKVCLAQAACKSELYFFEKWSRRRCQHAEKANTLGN